MAWINILWVLQYTTNVLLGITNRLQCTNYFSDGQNDEEQVEEQEQHEEGEVVVEEEEEEEQEDEEGN